MIGGLGEMKNAIRIALGLTASVGWLVPAWLAVSEMERRPFDSDYVMTCAVVCAWWFRVASLCWLVAFGVLVVRFVRAWVSARDRREATAAGISEC